MDLKEQTPGKIPPEQAGIKDDKIMENVEFSQSREGKQDPGIPNLTGIPQICVQNKTICTK